LKEYKALERLRKYLAETSDFEDDTKKFFVAAVTLDVKGQILSIRSNSYKTHPKMVKLSQSAQWGTKKIFLHAEVAALVSSQNKVHTIIIARMRRDGSLAIARPCPICQLAIKEAKVKKIYFTNEQGELTLLKEHV